MDEMRMLTLLKAHDPAGLEQLMSVYGRYVATVVWNVLRSSMTPEDAEEVVSDVFLSAWDHADGFLPGKVKGWLGTVARNKAKNKLREFTGGLQMEDDLLEWPDEAEPLMLLEGKEEAAAVRQAVDALPADICDVFLRHYYYLHSVSQIARETGLNENTIKTRLRRGRDKVKKYLTREGYAHET